MREEIGRRFPGHRRRLVVLDVPNQFYRDQPELIDLLEKVAQRRE